MIAVVSCPVDTDGVPVGDRVVVGDEIRLRQASTPTMKLQHAPTPRSNSQHAPTQLVINTSTSK
jgi:hypothetical protein